MFKEIKVSACAVSVLGSLILAFGLYQVHGISGVTEGGVLGLTLLLDHWLNLSPAISGFLLNGACYLLGAGALGRQFLFYSAASTVGFSVFYSIFEQFPPLWPELAEMPMLAAVLGALFVGIGVGICVRAGGAPTGDDALAMSLSRLFRFQIQWVYLISDLLILGASISYIPLKDIVWSLLTVVLSGQIIGLIHRIELPNRKGAVNETEHTENRPQSEAL